MGPLERIRIIDVTSMLSGPWATMILGDQGAEVIKVKMTGQRDHTRSLGHRNRGFSRNSSISTAASARSRSISRQKRAATC